MAMCGVVIERRAGEMFQRGALMLIGNGDVYGEQRGVRNGGTFACALVSSALSFTRLPIHVCPSQQGGDVEGSEMDVKGLTKCF